VLRRIFGSKRDEIWKTSENYTMKSFITCTLRQVNLGWQINEDEMGRECSMNGEESIQDITGKSRRKQTTRNFDIDERRTLRRILEK
jgi:hypothetical protein